MEKRKMILKSEKKVSMMNNKKLEFLFPLSVTELILKKLSLIFLSDVNYL